MSPSRWRVPVVGAVGVTALAWAFSSGEAQAQIGLGAPPLDALMTAFTRVAAFESSLTNGALGLFVTLAVMQIAWTFGRAAKAGADLPIIAGLAVEEAVVLGFWVFLMFGAGMIGRSVIQAMAMFANDASLAAGGSRNLSPTDLLGVGVNIARSAWSGVSIINPVQSLALAIGGYFVLASFAFLCFHLVEVIVWGYVVSSTCVLFLAFGGHEITRDIGVNALRSVLICGAQRFYIQLMVGLTEGLMRDLSNSAQANRASLTLGDLAVIIVVGVVLAGLVHTLPQRIATLVYGGGYSSHSVAGEASRRADMATKAAMAAAGMGAAATGSLRAAIAAVDAREAKVSAQNASGGGGGGGGSGGGSSGFGRAAQIAGLAAKGFAGALGSEMGNRLASGRGASHAGFGAARRLGGEAQALRAEAQSYRSGGGGS